MIELNQEKIDALPAIYLERLEERIVSLLARKLDIGISEALRVYYSSALANQVSRGDHGIQFRSAENLVADLLENEPGLFEASLR